MLQLHGMISDEKVREMKQLRLHLAAELDE